MIFFEIFIIKTRLYFTCTLFVINVESIQLICHRILNINKNNQEKNRQSILPKAFESKNYFLYFLGSLASVNGFQIFMFTESWITHELNESPEALGLLGLFTALPTIILNLFGGALADRFNKKLLITVCQIFTFFGVGLFAFLYQIDFMKYWHIYIFAAAGGAINAFELPARMSYYPLLINKDAMPSAVAMNSMTWQGTRVIAPAIAGLLIALFGGTTTLLICCVCFLLMIFFLNLTHVDISKLKQKGNPLQDIIDGLLFIYKNKLFLTIIGYSFFIGFFGWVYLTMMPYMAVQVLKVDSSGTGILMTSAGMGAVIPTVIFARAGINDRRMGISAGSFFSGISILLFAFTAYQFQSFYITMFFVFLIGLFSSVYMLSAISTIQLNVPDQLRGRIMGIYTITYSIISLGGLYSGLVGGFLDRLLATDHIGVPISIGLGGIIVIIGSICIYLFNESLKKEI